MPSEFSLQFASTSATRSDRRRGQPQVFSVSSSTGKKPQVAPYSGDMFADRRAVGEREADEPVPEVLDELPDHACRPQQLRDGQHQIGRSRALRHRAREPEADDLGISIDTASPSIAASASMPPTPQPSTPSPLIIVVCESVPTSVSGNAMAVARLDHAREELEVDLVHDAGVRRHDLEVVEGRLAPA